MNNAAFYILCIFIGFVLGVLFAVYAIDKPETVNHTTIEKVKTKGRGNKVDVSQPTQKNTNRRRLFHRRHKTIKK